MTAIRAIAYPGSTLRGVSPNSTSVGATTERIQLGGTRAPVLVMLRGR
jgi:hypothetical protein